MTTCTIFAKKDYVAQDGQIPIYLRLTIDRKVHPPIKLNKRTRPEHWNEITSRPLPAHPNCKLLTQFLDQIHRKGEDIILQHEISSRPITYQSFCREFAGLSPYDFYFLADNYRESKRGCSVAYLDKIRFIVQKMKSRYPVLNLHAIDYQFVSDYVNYLQVERGNNQNTINTNVKILRRIFRHGIKLKLVKENPFLEYRLTSIRSDRESLTLDEVRLYEKLLNFDLPFYLRQLLTWFLLAIATGRRFGDLETFDQWEFSAEHVKIIQMKRIHGRAERKVIMMYLNERIRILVASIQQNGYRLPSNTNANKFLKTLTELTGIKKKITFHCARHTFASINKQLTEDLTIRRDLLGHDSVKSTLIYEHSDPVQLSNMMKKWDAFN
jgi:integrase/recombinase XerD